MKQKQNPPLAEVLEIIKSLTDGSNYGILSSLDAYGCPRIRWMSSVVVPNFDHILALTAYHARKVTEIRVHPQVQWMFADKALEQVVNFSGHARILSEIPDKTSTWFQDNGMNELGMAVIETTVESIEFTAPRENILITLDPEEIKIELSARRG